MMSMAMGKIFFAAVLIVMALICLGCSNDEGSLHVEFRLQENRFVGCNAETIYAELERPESTRDIVLDDGWIWFALQKRFFVGNGALVRECIYPRCDCVVFVWLCESNQIWRVVYDITVPQGLSL